MGRKLIYLDDALDRIRGYRGGAVDKPTAQRLLMQMDTIEECEDTVSKDLLKTFTPKGVSAEDWDTFVNELPNAQHELIEQIRWERDIAIEQLNELGYSLGEKIKTNGETIYRQAAIAIIRNSSMNCDVLEENWALQNEIRQLPSAQPEREKAELVWSDEDASWKCSRCDCVFEEFDWEPEYNFCPNCGFEIER